MIEKIFPILTWLPGYSKSNLRGDLFAGLTVGVMLIPQGMAYAMLAGLPPVYGLYASIFPMIIYAFLGTSRQLSVAPVAMDSLLVASGVGVLAAEGSQTYISYAILLAMFVGAFQVLLGVLRFGFITNLLSKPVISGFTSAAAIIIAMSQLKHLLGIELEGSMKFFETVRGFLSTVGAVDWVTFLIGAGGIVFIVFVKKWDQRIPASLAVVLLGILSVQVFDLNVSLVGEIPSGLPMFELPEVSWEVFKDLAPLALTIAAIAYMEAFSVSKAIETQTNTKTVNPNQELVALGTSNIFGSLFQAFPVSGGFSRSAVNVRSGARTPLASLISAAVVILTILFFTSFFYSLPKAILASIIIVAVLGLFDVHYPRKLFRENKIDFVILVLTFLITLNVGMVIGIVSGISLSILHLIYKLAVPHIAILGKVSGHHEFRNISRFEGLESWKEMVLMRLDAPLTFINIGYFKDFVNAQLNDETKFVVVDAGPVSHLDATAADGLREMIQKLKERDVQFVICDLIGPTRDMFHKTGLMELLGTENIFIDLNEAVMFLTDHKGGDFKTFAIQHSD